jgi:hypothetical protein
MIFFIGTVNVLQDCAVDSLRCGTRILQVAEERPEKSADLAWGGLTLNTTVYLTLGTENNLFICIYIFGQYMELHVHRKLLKISTLIKKERKITHNCHYKKIRLKYSYT